MLARVRTAAHWGLEAFPVDCEVDVGPGLPGFTLVGLPDPSVREVRDRVWPALRNAGFRPPERRVTVNLAPAGRRKEGSSLDLAVAIGVLAATQQVPLARLEGAALLGELSLDGSLRAVRGTLPLAEAVWRAGAARLVCAGPGAPEAALVPDLAVHGANGVNDVAAWLRGLDLPRQAPAAPDRQSGASDDLADVRGQALARRALEIAAAGAHHLLLIGPPGSGKTMLARRLPGILPPLTGDEALTVTRLHSAAGLRPAGGGLMTRRPFRAPHHTLTRAGLVGGGTPPRPGELSLAHHGVLFLDEFAEYGHSLIEALREPLETGSVWISRAGGVAEFPARALVVAAMNPCRCGWLGHLRKPCRCTPTDLQQYGARVSGPMLDRLDLQVEVRALTSDELLRAPPGEPTAAVRDRVAAARERQRARGCLNALLPSAALRHGPLHAAAHRLIADAMDRGGMSGRGVHRALRVARTIADLAGEERVGTLQLAEALQYRAYEGRRFVGS
jgi:magnesium chelatase family protein